MTRDHDVKHPAPIESDAAGGVALPNDSEILDWLETQQNAVMATFARLKGQRRVMANGIIGYGDSFRQAVADAMLHEREDRQR